MAASAARCARDFRGPAQNRHAQWTPDRILIEPSGVADVAALLHVFDSDDIRPLIRDQHVFVVIDAGAFQRDYAPIAEYFAAQASLAQLLQYVNKADYGQPGGIGDDREHVADTQSARRDRAGSLRRVRSGSPRARAGPDHGSDSGRQARRTGRMISPTRHSALHHGVRVSPVRATSTASAPFWRPWRRGAVGQIERVKGIARAGSGWVHFDVAGGRPSVTAFAAQEGEEGRVVAIDRTVNEARLRAAFEACAVPAVS